MFLTYPSTMNPAPRLALTGFAILSLTTIGTAQLGIKLANGGLTGTTQQYLEGSYSPSLVPQTGMTLEAWITYDDSNLPTGWRYPTICRLNPNAGQEAYWLRVDAGNTAARNLAFGVQTASGLQRVTYVFTAGQLSTWTHVAATYDGSSAKLFLNGTQVASANILGGAMRDQGGVFRLGVGEVTGANEMWNGEIDEVRLWPFARTAAEIQSTMKSVLNGVPGGVSTWNLDFSGNDTSGGNNLTAQNSLKFGTNTLALNGMVLGGSGFGAGTMGCAGTPAAGISAQCLDGSTDFALTCVGAPAQGQGVGFLWAGAARLQTAFALGPFALWCDPSAPGLLVPVAADSFGLVRLPVPIPAGAKGSTLHLQFAFAAQGCNIDPYGSQGLTLNVQ